MPKHLLHLDQRNGCYGFTFLCRVFLKGGVQKNGPIPQENLSTLSKKLVKSVVHFCLSLLSFCLFVFLS